MLNYDYTTSEQFCKDIGLVWLGLEAVREADAEARKLEFTQAQVDAAMRHHLWQVKYLFNPKTYTFKGRLLIALKFIIGK